jgi:hypothetical protein
VTPNLKRLLLSPTGWEKDAFGIVHPPINNVELTFGPRSGVEIHEHGVVIIENGVRREATREESLRARAGFRQALGEAVADAAGVEPE